MARETNAGHLTPVGEGLEGPNATAPVVSVSMSDDQGGMPPASRSQLDGSAGDSEPMRQVSDRRWSPTISNSEWYLYDFKLGK